jgi:hypothetical protein
MSYLSLLNQSGWFATWVSRTPYACLMMNESGTPVALNRTPSSTRINPPGSLETLRLIEATSKLGPAGCDCAEPVSVAAATSTTARRLALSER